MAILFFATIIMNSVKTVSYLVKEFYTMLNASLVKEGIKFGATEGAKKLVILGLNAKDVLIGVGIGAAGAIGGSKIFKGVKKGVSDVISKTKKKANEIVEEAKKENGEKKKNS